MLALICFWMSGIVPLHHTDDLSMFATVKYVPGVQLTHASPPPAADTCVAHEWLQTIHTLHALVVGVSYSPRVITIEADALPTIVYIEPFDYTPNRAPPSLS